MIEILLTQKELEALWNNEIKKVGKPYLTQPAWDNAIAKAAQLKLLEALEKEGKIEHKTRVDRVKMAVVCTSTCWLCKLRNY